MAGNEHFDLIVRNATIIDGTKAPRYAGDIGVRGGRIAAIGRLDQARADREIDASGRIAAPGFIDAHTHDDRLLLSDRDMTPKVSQGVTTVVAGNCGISLAHSPGNGAATPPLDLLDTEGQWFRFPSFAAYREELAAKPAALNAACLVGHTTFRVAVMDRLDRAATPAEIAKMREMARESLAAGAIGVSTGTAYAPAAAATTEELIEVCRPLTEFGGLYVTHMRNEDDRITESMEETFAIGREPRGAGRDLAPQVRRHPQSRPLAGNAGVDRTDHAPAAGRPRLLSLHRVFHGAALRPAGAILEDPRHLVEAAPGILGARPRGSRAPAGRVQGRSRREDQAGGRDLFHARREGRAADTGVRGNDDRLGRPAARCEAAPAPVGHVPARAGTLLARPQALPPGDGGLQDDRAAGGEIRAGRARCC